MDEGPLTYAAVGIGTLSLLWQGVQRLVGGSFSRNVASVDKHMESLSAGQETQSLELREVRELVLKLSERMDPIVEKVAASEARGAKNEERIDRATQHWRDELDRTRREFNEKIDELKYNRRGGRKGT